MPKFQKTVRMLAASCKPERSASSDPRCSGGTTWASCAREVPARIAAATINAHRANRTSFMRGSMRIPVLRPKQPVPSASSLI